MNILVTGGAGYIGSHTVVALVDAGFTPIIVDDFSNSSREVITNLTSLVGKEITHYEGNVCDKKFLAELCEKEKIDGVIHFAAFKSPADSLEEPLSYYKNNLTGLITLLEVLEQKQITNLIFSSSAAVYGEPDENPISEKALRKKAPHPYGNTKAMCEDILHDVAKASPLRAIALRYFNPIGAHSSRMIGELPLGEPANLVPYLMQVAAGSRSSLAVFGGDYPTPDGTCIRDFIHVCDLAEAHVAALSYLADKKDTDYEVFNVGTGKGASVLELIQTFTDISGVSLPYEIVQRRKGDIISSWADTTNINTKIGWRAQKTLKEGLEDAWEWQKTLSQS